MFDLNCTARQLAPDPDVAGVAVVASFVAACALTMTMTWVSFFAYSEPKRRDVTYVDHLVNKWMKQLQKAIKRATGRTRNEIQAAARNSSDIGDDISGTNDVLYMQKMVESVVLGLSDTQILTGIGIIVSTLAKVDMSVYHASIAMNLAFFASAAHCSSIIIVRDALESYPWSKATRVFLQLTLLGMLLFLAVHQGSAGWFESLELPWRCVMASIKEGSWAAAGPWTYATLVLLPISFIGQVLYAYEREILRAMR